MMETWMYMFFVIALVYALVIGCVLFLAGRYEQKRTSATDCEQNATLDALRLRHSASRMVNGGYKGSEIDLKVYNGDV